MFNYYTGSGSQKIAELSDRSFIIMDVQDAVNILGNLGSEGCNRIIIHESNLPEDFFVLSTRLAGEILQKFSNYRVRLVIVGDFTKFKSKSLNDFIRESNRGNSIFFAETTDSAIKRLSIE